MLMFTMATECHASLILSVVVVVVVVVVPFLRALNKLCHAVIGFEEI